MEETGSLCCFDDDERLVVVLHRVDDNGDWFF